MVTIEELGALCMHSCVIQKLTCVDRRHESPDFKVVVTLNKLSNPQTDQSSGS